VVLRGFSGSKVLLNDPGRGSIKVGLEAFERSFGGTVLEFAPTDSFEAGGEQPSTWRFARKRLRGMRGPILFVALATLSLAMGLARSILSGESNIGSVAAQLTKWIIYVGLFMWIMSSTDLLTAPDAWYSAFVIVSSFQKILQ
jgi:ABC-type bacteriocin/lantibiotic exporter with double-glycine peptidase domain